MPNVVRRMRCSRRSGVSPKKQGERLCGAYTSDASLSLRPPPPAERPGPAGPPSLKICHWPIFRALRAPSRGSLLVGRNDIQPKKNPKDCPFRFLFGRRKGTPPLFPSPPFVPAFTPRIDPSPRKCPVRSKPVPSTCRCRSGDRPPCCSCPAAGAGSACRSR